MITSQQPSTRDVLCQLGFSENESKVYDVLLTLKKARPSRIAEEAQLSRGTTYHVLTYLSQKGLVLKFRTDKNTYLFSPKNPKEGILELLEAQQKILEKRNRIFQNAYETIMAQYSLGSNKIRFSYFEGKKGFWNFFLQTLDVHHPPMRGYTTHIPINTHGEYKKFQKQYAKLRFQKRLYGKYLTLQSEEANTRTYIQTYYKRYLRVVPDLVRFKILPKTSISSVLNETIIFDDKYAMSNGYNPNGFLGVIIEDENITNTQRTLFDVLWKTAKTGITLI